MALTELFLLASTFLTASVLPERRAALGAVLFGAFVVGGPLAFPLWSIGLLRRAPDEAYGWWDGLAGFVSLFLLAWSGVTVYALLGLEGGA